MKKQIILVFVLLLGMATLSVAAPAQKDAKITNTRIVQATQNTTVTYAGMKIFVPQGKTVILGQNTNGAVVVRGQDIDGVKIDNTTVSFPGIAVFSINPQSRIITVNRGEQVSITDANGRTAVLSQGASISALDIRTATAPTLSDSQATAKTQQAVTKAQEKAAKKEAAKAQSQAEQNEQTDATQLPDFVAGTATSSTAAEQAAQNVEETETTLSPSVPR